MNDNNKYCYGLHARPASPGAIPNIPIEQFEKNDKRARHGVIYFLEELSVEMIEQYELINLNKYGSAGLSFRDIYQLSGPVRSFVQDYDQSTAEVFSEDRFPGQKRLTAHEWLRVVIEARAALVNETADSLYLKNGRSWVIELAHSKLDRCVSIVPSTTEPQYHKLVWFDRLGPIGDMNSKPRDLLQTAINQGYTVLVPGIVDSFSETFDETVYMNPGLIKVGA